MRKLGVVVATVAFSIVLTTTAVRAEIIHWNFSPSSFVFDNRAITGSFDWNTSTHTVDTFFMRIQGSSDELWPLLILEPLGWTTAVSSDFLSFFTTQPVPIARLDLIIRGVNLDNASGMPTQDLLECLGEHIPIPLCVPSSPFPVSPGIYQLTTGEFAAVPGPVVGAGLPGLV